MVYEYAVLSKQGESYWGEVKESEMCSQVRVLDILIQGSFLREKMRVYSIY